MSVGRERIEADVRRWEVAALIGPCSKSEADFLAEALAEISGPLGGAVWLGPWNVDANAPEAEAKLLAALAAAEAENARLREALQRISDEAHDPMRDPMVLCFDIVREALASRPGDEAAS